MCLAVVMSCVGFAGISASAEGVETPQSEWEMTVPQIRVTTENGNGTTLEKEDGYQNAQISITGTDGSTLSDACLFKVRGNTTALNWVKKKAFTFKFEKKKDVLGMGKGKKWALIANTFDPTLLRNYLAFSIAKEMGLAYTSNFQFVELWVDDTFRGCYLLMEPVQEGKDRVNIDIEGDDGKKDFLMEYEAQREEEGVTYFKVDGLRFIASEPEEPTEEQLAYIQETVQGIVSAIRSGTREEIEAKIDVTSFAKFFLLNEYLKTFDFNMSSVFFYYQDGKLYAGPPWDYDLSAGNSNPEYGTRGRDASMTENVFADKNIYKFLCKQSWFKDEVRKVYCQYYDYFTSISADGGLLDTAYAQYADIIGRNYYEAGWNIGKYWINIQKKPLATYAENFDYLKTWLAQRHEWMTGYYQPVEDYILGDADGDGVVTINDVTVIQRVLAEAAELANPLTADVNKDGVVTIEDATLIQNYLAEMIEL